MILPASALTDSAPSMQAARMDDAEKRSGRRASSEPGSRMPGGRHDLDGTSDRLTRDDPESPRVLGPDSEATQILGTEGEGSAGVDPRDACRTPVRWGPLELIEKVGEGAFGETYRARDTRLERE